MAFRILPIAATLSNWIAVVSAVGAAIGGIAAAFAAWFSWSNVKEVRGQWKTDRDERQAATRRRQRSILVALKAECEINTRWWAGPNGSVEPLTMPIWETARADLSDLDTALFAAVNAAYLGMQRTHARMAENREWLDRLDSQMPGHREEHVVQLNRELRDKFMAPTAERWKEAIREIERFFATLDDPPERPDPSNTSLPASVTDTKG